MRVTYTTADGRITVEADVTSQAQAWGLIAGFQEVFESDKKCGCCGCPDLRFVVRRVDDNSFYELHCRWPQCRARKSFGVHKTGGSLFPHRKDKDGQLLPNNGWIKWEGGKDAERNS